MLKNGWPTCPNLAGTGETIQGHGAQASHGQGSTTSTSWIHRTWPSPKRPGIEDWTQLPQPGMPAAPAWLPACLNLRRPTIEEECSLSSLDPEGLCTTSLAWHHWACPV